MKKFRKISIHLLVICLLVLPVFVYSGDTPTTPSNTTEVGVVISNPFKGGSTLMELIVTIMNNIIMPIAAVAVVVFIVWAGFTFVLAQGKPAEIEKAKQRLLWSLVGAGILLGAAAIAAVVKSTVESLITTP